MSSEQYIEDSLTRHQVYLLRAIGTTTNEIKELLSLVVKKTTDRLRVEGKEFTPRDLRKIRDEMVMMIENLGIKNTVKDALADFAEYEIEYFEGLLIKATSAEIVRTAPKKMFNTVTKDKMTLYNLDGTKKTMTIDTMVDDFTGSVSGNVKAVMSSGIAEGKSVDAIAKDVKRRVEKRSMRQAEALVRTATNHIMSETRAEVAKANTDVITGEEYVATLDSRVTILCSSLDGNVYDVGVGPQPPMHFSCRSIRTPKIDSKFGLDGITGKRPFVTQDKDGNKVIGQVTGATKYENWLKRQPVAFQEEVLGKKRAKLFRSGDITLDKFMDEKYRVIPLKELRKLDGIK